VKCYVVRTYHYKTSKSIKTHWFKNVFPTTHDTKLLKAGDFVPVMKAATAALLC